MSALSRLSAIALLGFAGIAGPFAGTRIASAQNSDSVGTQFVARLNVTIKQAKAGGGDLRTISRRVCQDLTSWALDIESMMIAASANAWERMTPAQRTAYEAAFRRSFVKECAERTADSLEGVAEFAGARNLQSGERLIATRWNPDASERTLLWQIRIEGSDKFFVTDLFVQGRSAVLASRDHAGVVLEKNGGDIDDFIKSLDR